MKQFIVLLLLLVQFGLFSQENTFFEKPPLFANCENITLESQQDCFDRTVFKLIFETFKVPQKVMDDHYKGETVVLFEVDTTGKFNVIYVDAMYDELKTETKRVFSEFPKIIPGTYNGKPTYKQYSIQVKIPLEDQTVKKTNLKKQEEVSKLELEAKLEFDKVNKALVPFKNKTYSSQLNIPFTHFDYSKFDRNMSLVGTNSHTASKPFLYEEVSNYYNFEEENEKLQKPASSWVNKKLWNEHMVQLQGDDYWFTIDPIFDLELGKDFNADFNTTYNNTRGLLVKGGLGETFNFYATIFESQGRFAQYVNEYAESLKGFGPDPAIIPGRGIAKRFKTDSFDYPVAEAYISYSPAKFINIQFGHGKNFIGDGYRSLFLSDVASPHPFLKLNTKFWKIKYTNTWMWLKDVRPEATVDGAFLTKYMANHYLSWNVSKRLNVGLFESVLWTNTNDRGFDVNYLNPIIFYRAIEFETGQGAGNAIVGASGKYKVNDNINLYSQFILDEFSLSDVKAGEKSWKNKFGYQLGVKYFNAFNVDNLLLQFEYNRVRPYTYSHNTIVLNYGHNNQSMAHLWGANFSETIIIGRYHYKRWFGDAKLIFGVRGFDYNNGTDNFSYGGDIFRNYNDRPFDSGVEVGQGIKTNSFYANLQAGYVINPASNLKIFTDITFRNFNPDIETVSTFNSNTVWFNLGLRTDLFNWYFDF
ncbi:MAG: gliding motility protein RemB [Flavobacteriales bacterium]|nr:gliding motility protein RemB [Flavobacteriia bacterium]NCP06559.1 gliding motility protein RemB [Flavobacteriales bacterium]PIV94346.1 MAG: gliding motility protein RemB [Flavobacteriaceae bacterium CG17_big_fil_post_rev_8_21_14_2_50_33_15]PIY10397.1 MAG: gliding motility protein RemB [Flavobacteriaceae bacterium CG_4_10_14_3_um_filter_33_47]PJB20446.1 MAG: gliding motility protein RemB [Flavobacteriaceae bacterium CG_4_9_14_3_um_filter_33_16]